MSSKDDVLEFDTKISEDDMGGSSSNTGEFDLGTAVELLGLDDEDAKTQTSKLQGAYMSFLLLRHLRLRDLQRSVRNMWDVGLGSGDHIFITGLTTMELLFSTVARVGSLYFRIVLRREVRKFQQSTAVGIWGVKKVA